MIRTATAIEAPIEAVFHAVAHPDGILAVFPFSDVASEMREGGRIVLSGTTPDGPFRDVAVIREFDPPRRFRYDYRSSNRGRPRETGNEARLTYRLTPHGSETHLVVEHDRLSFDAVRVTAPTCSRPSPGFATAST